MTVEGEHEDDLVRLRWLIRLRWVACVLQVGLIFVAQSLVTSEIGWGVAFLGPILLALTNGFALRAIRLTAASERSSQKAHWPPRSLIRTLVFLDACILTALLACYGGYTNPLSMVYLVHVLLASTLLGERDAWAMVFFSALCFALLFVAYVPVPQFSVHQHGGASGFSLHLVGMYVSFVILAVVLAFFLAQLRREMRARDGEINRLREQATQDRQLNAITTLAAGAAHELATPLSTLKLIVSELGLFQSELDSSLRGDIETMSNEIHRCERILAQMRAQASDFAGEMERSLTVTELERDLREALADLSPERIDLRSRGTDLLCTIPLLGWISTVRALVKNALEASSDHQPVRIAVSTSGEMLRVEVSDSGHGIEADLLSRLGEPFVTTKPTGKGMGLGLFLAKGFARNLGGRVEIQSQVGIATTVTLVVPVKTPLRIAV